MITYVSKLYAKKEEHKILDAKALANKIITNSNFYKSNGLFECYGPNMINPTEYVIMFFDMDLKQAEYLSDNWDDVYEDQSLVVDPVMLFIEKYVKDSDVACSVIM